MIPPLCGLGHLRQRVPLEANPGHVMANRSTAYANGRMSRWLEFKGHGKMFVAHLLGAVGGKSSQGYTSGIPPIQGPLDRSPCWTLYDVEGLMV